MKLSLPYTFQISLLAEKYSDDVYDVYYTDGYFDSARGGSGFDEDKEIKIKDLERIKAAGIKLNYVLNPPYIDNTKLNHYDDIIEHLLKNKKYIDIVTVNNLVLAKNKDFVKKLKEHFIMKSSVNLHINSLDRMERICRDWDFDNINIDRGINRDIELIKKMTGIAREYNKTVTILANEGCLFDCIMKRDCDLTFSSISDKSKEETEDIKIFNCYSTNFKKRNIEYLKAPWITAEGVEILEDYIDVLKISGRYDPIEEIEDRIKYYLFNDRNTFLRNVLDKVLTKKDEIYDLSMMELSAWGLTKTLTNCKNECYGCNLCEDFLNKYKEEKDGE